jgi:hypothetical protein
MLDKQQTSASLEQGRAAICEGAHMVAHESDSEDGPKLVGPCGRLFVDFTADQLRNNAQEPVLWAGQVPQSP